MLVCDVDKMLENWGVCGNAIPRSSLKECVTYLSILLPLLMSFQWSMTYDTT